jgi:hypothetical protein
MQLKPWFSGFELVGTAIFRYYFVSISMHLVFIMQNLSECGGIFIEGDHGYVLSSKGQEPPFARKTCTTAPPEKELEIWGWEGRLYIKIY